MTVAYAAIDRAREWARFYLDCGFNPLPSASKVPAFRGGYRDIRDRGIPPEAVGRFWTSDVQVCTGARWGLVVLDLDGFLAPDAWRALAAGRERPPTWTVRTRSGFHLWYSVPEGSGPYPHKATLWSLPHARHQAVEVLGDKNLAVAPPSSYSDGTGRYRFLPGRSPRELLRPAPLPAWLRALALDDRRRAVTPDLARHLPAAEDAPLAPAGRYSRSAVLSAIPDKVALVREWGVRVLSDRPGPRGWVPCRSVVRDDLGHPNASVSAETGLYWDWADGLRLSLFDLGAVAGPFGDWRDCLNSLGRRYGVPQEVRRAG